MRSVSSTACTAVALGALGALGACGSAPAATTEFFGPTIEPPRGLGKIRPGMSVAEAKRLVPQLHEPKRPGVRDELVLDSGVDDVALELRVDAGTVSSIIAIVKGRQTARELLTRAWGSPTITRDSLGQPEVTWASEATGWKVKLDCIERNCLVEYVPYHVLESEFFGAHVVPPGDLANLRIGMKLAEARTLAPGPIDVRAGIATGVDGVREFVAVDDRLGTVRSIYLNLPQHAETLIADAWGEGWIATEPVGKRVLVWPDPTTRWRAILRDALGYSRDLAYDNYLPAADLFGDQPDRLDALPEPILGRTVEQIRAAYKEVPGVDVVIQGREIQLALQPTEWERFSTRITLELAGGKVKQLAFAIPFKPHPEARDTLLELFKHKWGEPREGEPRPDANGKPTWIFHDEDPHVEVIEDTEHGAWRFELR